MIVRQVTGKDVNMLVPLYQEMLLELNEEIPIDKIIEALKQCASETGILLSGYIGDDLIAIMGGIQMEDNFMGDHVYVKPEYRDKSYHFISQCIRRIKAQAKQWYMLCTADKFKMWEKIGFKSHRILIVRDI